MAKKNKEKKTKKFTKNNLISEMGSKGFTYLGDSNSGCGDIKLGYHTMFEIQRLNTEAQQSKNLIAKMVGKLGIKFKKGDEIVEDTSRKKTIKQLFTDPVTNSFRSLRDQYYTNHFCSGMIFGYIATDGLGRPRMQILDSRYVSQELDDYGNIKWIKYGSSDKELDLKRVVKQVTQYDPDLPGYGMSVYESIVFDALSDRESSKRNYYYFKNNAMPGVIITLDDEIENPEEMTQAIKQFEDSYKGAEKSHKVLATGGVKEVRTLDVSNKDIELLELKKFSIKKMGIIFGFDPRFLGFKDDSNGSHAEYQIMAGQSDKSMTNFADTLEEFMISSITKAYRDFPYDGIELINDQFLDKQLKQDLIIQKVEKGLLTPKQGIIELGYSSKDIPDYMDTFMINTQWNSIENILNKSALDQKQIEETTKAIGEEPKEEEEKDTQGDTEE